MKIVVRTQIYMYEKVVVCKKSGISFKDLE